MSAEGPSAEDGPQLLDGIPVQSWDVRRRRYAEGHWLVRHNEVFEIDAVTDAVWRACGDRLRLGAIARRVADELDLPPASMLEPTISALKMLGDNGLVHFEDEG